ncbi:hypothetical protein BGZ65_003069 [Modicella reniformis]|uniref:F-box domain-containing protein n=1 Tax=Modicella reniformis TaxID=1440133 RepID=A0A9P6IL35_9FUNG|nr:hypothetical protein BGZ65_003069 [Modicella reniformis]
MSTTQVALSSPEILYAIGESIPIFVEINGSYAFKPRNLLDCCLVSKVWRSVLTPLLWRIDDTKSMYMVPILLLVKNSHLVKTYLGESNRWFAKREFHEPPNYSQLRQLSMGDGVKCGKIAMRMINSNRRLESLKLINIPLFEQLQTVETVQGGVDGDGGGGVGATGAGAEGDGNNAGNQDNEKKDQDNNNNNNKNKNNDNGLTNPLAHLRTTLQELTINQASYQGMEFYYLLRSVAKGNLRTLRLRQVVGTFDLQDLVFDSLTRLTLWLDDKVQPGLHEIVGRAPFLEHLELQGPSVEVVNHYSLESLGNILRGTKPQETIRQRQERLRQGDPEPRLWPRPQLKSFTVDAIHVHKPQAITTEQGNDHQFLDLIRACSSVYDMYKPLGTCGSLQELDIPLWAMDDLACEAIVMNRSSLKVLKIRVLPSEGIIRTWRLERQGRVLRKILQSCSSLKTLEFWDQNESEDISVVMTGLIGDHKTGGPTGGGDIDTEVNSENSNQRQLNKEKVQLLNCPELESLTLESRRPVHWMNGTEMKEEAKRFPIDDNEDKNDGDGDNKDVVDVWVMPKQTWDSSIQDGTDILLDAHWSSFELFEDVVENIGQPMEGEELIKRFLHHISPSKKLKELQLGQLVFNKFQESR